MADRDQRRSSERKSSRDDSRRSSSSSSRSSSRDDSRRSSSRDESRQRPPRDDARRSSDRSSSRDRDRNRDRQPPRDDGRRPPIEDERRGGCRGCANRSAVIAVIVLVIICLAAYSFMKGCDSSIGNVAEAVDSVVDTTVSVMEDEPESIVVSIAGDCTLGTDEYFNYSTSFNAKYEAVDDPSWFFANVYDIFSTDDLTIVNMEGVLTESTSRADKTYAFKGDAEYAQVLVEGGVEAASMANNHSHDYGTSSYDDTVEALEAAGIATFGYDEIAYMDVEGTTIALIGTYELAEGLGIQESMEANIATAQEEGADIVIVYFHWGTEKSYVPDETQVTLAHAAVDAGADLVVGSHPHVIQGYEEYNGVNIVYSLGNFCFGGNSNPSDKDCIIVQQEFLVTAGGGVSLGELTVIPCSVSSSSSSNNYQPTPAEGTEYDRIWAKIEESNESIATLSAQVSGA